MRVVSVNAGQPREISWRGHTVRTGIFKSPQSGPRQVTFLNVEGDAQADLRVHGGRDKAVYVFASENYAFWRRRYPQHDMAWGFFGENLTTAGLHDEDVVHGDRYRVGEVELQVTLPRLPCSRLALRFDDEGIVAAFLARLRVGFYCAVVREGRVQAEDAVVRLSRPEGPLRIPELAGLFGGLVDDPELLARAAATPTLPESWRRRFRARLQAGSAPARATTTHETANPDKEGGT